MKPLKTIHRQDGFTLTELIVVMAIFVSVLIISSAGFNSVLTNSGQLLKSAETQIEGVVGLELFRSNLQQVGYGLPWVVPANLNYAECTVTTVNSLSISALNDGPSGVPHAVLSINNAGYNDSDYLTVKAASISHNNTARKWTYLHYSSTDSPGKRWDSTSDIANGERVVVLRSSFLNGLLRKDLVVNGTTFFTTASVASNVMTLPTAFSPLNATDTYLVYGVDPDTDLTMPFNRADFYISRPDNIPSACAPHTGVLYKAIVNQSNGRFSYVALLDCVADLQVVYSWDSDGDGTIDSHRDASFGTPGAQGPVPAANVLRNQLREIRVYILAQEGQKDLRFSYPNQTVTVGEFGMGHDVDLAAVIGANWRNYRWKVYTIVVQPKNLN